MAETKYKLLKDTPYDKAGVELFNYGENYGYASRNSYLVEGKCYPVEEVENNPDWFQPLQPDEAECKIQSCQQENCLPHCPCDCHQPHLSEGEIEKLENYKYPEQMTFDDVIDIKIKLNELIEAFNTLKRKE